MLNKPKKNSPKARVWLFRTMMAAGIFVSIILVIFYINLGPRNTSSYKGSRKVTIKHINGQYAFYKDGKPFLVKGGAGFTHIKELAECGGNTLTCWDTSQIESTLQEAAENNIEVIIGLDIPGGEDITFYNNEKNVADLYNGYISIVNRYKNHPALLAWCLGNELSVPFSFTPTPFYKTYNRILDKIHNIDPNHPVSTSIINIAKRRIMMIQWRMPSLDFYCINVYNSIKTLQQDLNFMKLVWRGPYLIGEWAPNGGWEAPLTVWQAPIENTSTKKAEQFYDLFLKHMPVKDPRFLGSVAFYWGYRQEYTCTWFSIFDEKGSPTEMKEALFDCWRDTVTQHVSPRLQYMLIDNLGAQDNIILTPGSKHNAFVVVQMPKSSFDTLRYSWQILKEDWMLYWGKTFKFLKKPPSEIGLFADSALQNTSFTTPLQKGPYRVFVTVYNSKGYCANANVPIYVEQ